MPKKEYQYSQHIPSGTKPIELYYVQALMALQRGNSFDEKKAEKDGVSVKYFNKEVYQCYHLQYHDYFIHKEEHIPLCTMETYYIVVTKYTNTPIRIKFCVLLSRAYPDKQTPECQLVQTLQLSDWAFQEQPHLERQEAEELKVRKELFACFHNQEYYKKSDFCDNTSDVDNIQDTQRHTPNLHLLRPPAQNYEKDSQLNMMFEYGCPTYNPLTKAAKLLLYQQDALNDGHKLTSDLVKKFAAFELDDRLWNEMQDALLKDNNIFVVEMADQLADKNRLRQSVQQSYLAQRAGEEAAHKANQEQIADALEFNQLQQGQGQQRQPSPHLNQLQTANALGFNQLQQGQEGQQRQLSPRGLKPILFRGQKVKDDEPLYKQFPMYVEK